MHYKLGPDIVIKTENAAKSWRETNSFLETLLADLPHADLSFDYGCGKLRYFQQISRRSGSLTVVDSDIQLTREQRILDRTTSIRAFVGKRNSTCAQSIKEFGASATLYDRGYCINVLSVIPILAERARVLRLIRSKLKPGGTCLFVVQYRNSEFTKMARSKKAVRWRDGILLKSLRGYSFYGLISPERLGAAVKAAGFKIQSTKLNEGSAYIWATA